MSNTLSSAYNGLASLLQQAGHFLSPAELQGILIGRSCATDDFSESCWIELKVFLEEGEITEQLKNAVLGLQAMIQQELTTDNMALTLLLPSDDMPLTERLHALIHWCQGFLSGFGMVQKQPNLSRECLDVLEDVSSVAQLETQIAEEDEARSEADYMELVEYLRVVPMMLYGELNTDKAVTSSSKVVH